MGAPRTSPIERLHRAGTLSRVHKRAADRYEAIAHRAEGDKRSVDLTRPFIDNPRRTEPDMTASLMARRRLAAVAGIVGPVHARVLHLAIVDGRTLKDIASRLGWGTQPAGRGTATNTLKDALDLLARHWGWG